jgi:3-mercaptopyruvate sulfurtransferase SseA
MRSLILFLLGALTFSAAAWTSMGIQIDPQTGRAVGAKEMSPAELRKLIDEHGKLLIIDVREPEAFQKGTIKGAINIPLEQLKGRLKDIPKDTTLVFT